MLATRFDLRRAGLQFLDVDRRHLLDIDESLVDNGFLAALGASTVRWNIDLSRCALNLIQPPLVEIS